MDECISLKLLFYRKIICIKLRSFLQIFLYSCWNVIVNVKKSYQYLLNIFLDLYFTISSQSLKISAYNLSINSNLNPVNFFYFTKKCFKETCTNHYFKYMATLFQK